MTVKPEYDDAQTIIKQFIVAIAYAALFGKKANEIAASYIESHILDADGNCCEARKAFAQLLRSQP